MHELLIRAKLNGYKHGKIWAQGRHGDSNNAQSVLTTRRTYNNHGSFPNTQFESNFIYIEVYFTFLSIRITRVAIGWTIKSEIINKQSSHPNDMTEQTSKYLMHRKPFRGWSKRTELRWLSDFYIFNGRQNARISELWANRMWKSSAACTNQGMNCLNIKLSTDNNVSYR